MFKVGHCTSAVATAGAGCVLLTGFLGLGSNTHTGEMGTHITSDSAGRPEWCQGGWKALFLGRAGLLWTIYTAAFWEAGHPLSRDDVSAKSLGAGTATPWVGSRPLAQGVLFSSAKTLLCYALAATGKRMNKLLFWGSHLFQSLIGLVSTVT